MLIKSLSVQVSGFLPHGNHAETCCLSPPPALSKISSHTTVWDHLLFPVSPYSPSLSPLGLTLKWLGLVSLLVEGGCFTSSFSSQLFLKNTITNMIAPAWGSVLRWKMRYKIYLRFLLFGKIESSHFNCSRLGVLLQATGTGALYVVPCSLQTIMFHCAKCRLWLALSLSSILFRII